MAHHRRVKGAGEGEDKPCFQGPALQPTHHCHRACSCLGPEHRRLIKAPCRFSPLITLARRLRAGKRKGCGLRYLPPGPRGSLALASFPPPRIKKNKLILRTRRRGQKQAPSPAAAAGPDGGGTPRPRPHFPAKAGPSLGRVGWHRFLGWSGNSPVHTAAEGLSG